MAQFSSSAGSAIRAGTVGVGLRNVGSYQVAGHPYITGSALTAGQEKKIVFPYVTKKITIIASGSQTGGTTGGLRVHFVATGSGNVVGGKHYLQFDSHEDSMDLDVKCKEIYVSSPGGAGAFFLYASLTGIPTGRMYALTGSGISD